MKPTTGSLIIPCLRYANAVAAIDWLCKAFGFERHAVYQGDDGTVHHAQLVFGTGMVMLGDQREGEFVELQQTVAMAGGRGTQSPYVIVPDVDAHHARAVEHGAKIVMVPTDQDYGGRNYACLDPEGNLWNFGSYDPWAPTPAT